MVTPESDAEFGDSFVDISVGAKRWIRASTKNYSTTGTYIFLKLFKKNDKDLFERSQYVSLSSDEWEALIEKSSAVFTPASSLPPSPLVPAPATTPVSKKRMHMLPPDAPRNGEQHLRQVFWGKPIHRFRWTCKTTPVSKQCHFRNTAQQRYVTGTSSR